MKILVTVKRVVDPYAQIRPSADGSYLDSFGAKHEINPFDEIAVEEAVRIRDRIGDVEIVAVSIGGSECEEQLRKALAMGADRAILVESQAPSDSTAVAAELEEVVRAENPDLVLMGKQATDDDRNQAGQILAARLGWPQATFASKIEIAGATVRVTRETDDGDEVLEFELPGVVTADLRLNEPRYISMPGILKARGKPLDRQPAIAAVKPKVQIISYRSPAARSAGRKVSSAAELVQALRDRGLVDR